MGMIEGGRYERYELPDRITSHRNVELTKYAGQVWTKTSDQSELENALQKANSERCVPPLSEKEVHGIVKSISTNYKPGLSPEYEAMRSERRDAARAVESAFNGVHINDVELSAVFAEMYRDRLRYVFEARGWYSYDGTRWVTASEGGSFLAHRAVKEFSNRLVAWAAELSDSDKTLRNVICNYRSNKGLLSLLSACQSEMLARVAEFDKDPLLFHCRNCTLDLHGGRVESRPNSPADMLTMTAGCDYDPEAEYAEWRRFLLDTFEGDEERLGFFQMAVGRALAGDTSLHRFYIANGPTRTGKSTTLDTLLAMFGDYGGSMQPETLNDGRRNKGTASSDVARLAGKRFVVCPELPARMQLDVAQMKQWTGGDTVTARRLYQGEFDFHPVFQLWVNTNYLPNVTDPTLFTGDRCVVVPFERFIPEGERDRGLKARLMSPRSLSSILNWALDGYRMLALSDGHMPDSCRTAVSEYETDSDRMGDFIADECEAGPDKQEDGARLYTKYREWSQGNGYGSLGRNNFYGELARRDGISDTGAGRINGKYTRHVFTGLRLWR